MPRIGLDTAQVVEEAGRMADRDGIDAVSISSLARTFGVSHAALYNHIGSVDALRTEIAILGMKELAAVASDATIGRARRDAVTSLAGAYVGYARQRPGVYSTTVRAPDAQNIRHEAAAAALLRVVYQTLSGFGLNGDDLIHVTRHLRSLLHGFVSIEAAGGWGLPIDIDESFRRMVASYIDEIERTSATS